MITSRSYFPLVGPAWKRCRWTSPPPATPASARKYHVCIGIHLPGDIIDEEGANCAAVIGACNGPEVFLSRRIPNLQLYYLLIDLDCLCCELNANGDVVLCVYLLLDELLDDAGFSDS
jgi:hypothetical protein